MPGIINILSLGMIAKVLSSDLYGIFSTTLATSLFLSNFIYGPITFAVVSQHTSLESKQDRDRYESSIVSTAIMISIFIVFVGLLSNLVFSLDISWIYPAIGFGIYTPLQVMLQARTRIVAYGMVALFQALLLIILIEISGHLFIERNETLISIYLGIYGLSYFLGACVSFWKLKFPKLMMPSYDILKKTISLGSTYTLSNVAENALTLGSRYLVTFFGSSEYLSIYTFCLDLSQRLVGFMIDAVSFVYVPQAYLNSRDSMQQVKSFTKMLLSGALIGVALSILAMAFVAIIWRLEVFSILGSDVFNIYVFSIVSIAVSINRTKKMVLDNIAFKSERAFTIVYGYLLCLPVAFGTGVLTLYDGSNQGAELMLLIGYFFSFICTLVLLRKNIGI